jgi:hypothetical protein
MISQAYSEKSYDSKTINLSRDTVRLGTEGHALVLLQIALNVPRILGTLRMSWMAEVKWGMASNVPDLFRYLRHEYLHTCSSRHSMHIYT